MALKTDFVDDILDTSKNETRVYNIKSKNGTSIQENVIFEDVTEYSQNGSTFNAQQINATNSAVNTLNENLSTFSFRDNNGTAEYRKSGADTWHPFKSGYESVVNHVDYADKTYTCSKNGIVTYTMQNVRGGNYGTSYIYHNGVLIDSMGGTTLYKSGSFDVNAGDTYRVVPCGSSYEFLVTNYIY